MGSNPISQCPYTETHTQRKMPDEDTHRGRRWPSDNRGRDWGDTAVSQGTLRIAGRQPKLERGKEGFGPGSQLQHGPADTLI